MICSTDIQENSLLAALACIGGKDGNIARRSEHRRVTDIQCINPENPRRGGYLQEFTLSSLPSSPYCLLPGHI